MIITRDQVKLYLGITDSSLDAEIDRYLPIIDSKVKLITNHNWNDFYYCNIDSTKYIEVVEFKGESLEPGMQITGSGIPTGAYITNIFMHTAEFNNVTYEPPFIEISEIATETETSAELYFGFPIAYHPTVAKGVLWLIQQENQTIPSQKVKSKSLPPLSVTYDLNSKIDNRSGMPEWFVSALPYYMGGL